MKHYVVDGYNALFYLFHGHPLPSFEKAREALIQKIHILADQLSSDTEFIIVFDAHESQESSYSKEGESRLFTRTHKGAIEIVYTGYGETADAYIKDFFSAMYRREPAKARAQYILISSDKGLAQSIRSLGFTSMDISSFITFMSTRTKKKRRPASSIQDIRPQSQSLKTAKSRPQNTKKSPNGSIHQTLNEWPHESDIEGRAQHPQEKRSVDFTLKESTTPQYEARYTSKQLPTLDNAEAWLALFEEKLSEYEQKRQKSTTKKKPKK